MMDAGPVKPDLCQPLMQPSNPRSANRSQDDSCLAILMSWDSIGFYMSVNKASYMHGFLNQDRQ